MLPSGTETDLCNHTHTHTHARQLVGIRDILPLPRTLLHITSNTARVKVLAWVHIPQRLGCLASLLKSGSHPLCPTHSRTGSTVGRCACIRIQTHPNTHMHTHMHTHMRTHMRTHTHKHTCTPHPPTHTHTHTHT